MGGATEYFNVIPDLACYGKAFGNGAPAGLIVGRDALAEHGEVVSGTYSGDAVAAGALMSTLNEYQQHDVVGWMWKRGRQLQLGLADAITHAGIEARLEGSPVHQRIVFANDALGPLFAMEMAKRGVLWNPACTNIMRAHTEADIERVVDAAEESLRELVTEEGAVTR